MKDLYLKYYKVVIAQVLAYGISVYLVTYVFVGPLPVLSPSFKRSVAESPQKIAETVKDIPSKVVEFASAVKSRIPGKKSAPPAGESAYLPSPWILKVTIPTPTPFGTPPPGGNQQPPSNPSNPQPTSTQPRIPIPTIFNRQPLPTAAQREPTPIPTRVPTATPIPQPTKPVNLALIEKETVDEINKKRQENNLPPVYANAKLAVAGRNHANWMKEGSGLSRCGHTGSGGSSPFDRAKAAGYTGGGIGEVVACGYGTPKAAVDAWMNSPGHRAILLKREMKEVGVGWGNTMSVAIFGR